MEKSDKQTDVSHPKTMVNPLQTLKSQKIYVQDITFTTDTDTEYQQK
jgi:hypothetical protein